MIKPMLSAIAILSLVVFSLCFPQSGQVSAPVIYFFQALLLLHISGALRSFSRAWGGLNKYSKTALIVQVVMWSAIALLHHPGFVNQDTFSMQAMLHRNHLSQWITVAYTLLVKLFFDLDPSLFLYAFFHIFILICCVYKCFKIAQPKSWFIVIAITLLTAHPLLQASTLYLTRDILFCLLTVYLVLCFGEKYFNKAPMDFSFLAHVVLITFLLTGMRQEGLLYLGVFPALVFFLGVGLDVSKKIATCSLLVLFAVVWNVSLSRQLSQTYQFSGVVQQLNYLVHTQHENITPVQKAVISKVVNYDYMVKNYSPNSVAVFHNDDFTLPVSDKDWNSFLSTYRELVVTYPADFLRERMDLFALTLNLTGVPYVYPDKFDDRGKAADFMKSTYGVKRWNLAPELTALHKKFLDSIYPVIYLNPVLKIFNPGSPLLLLLLSVVAVVFCRHKKMISFYIVTSVFCYCRIPAVFFLAAEPEAKYYAILIYYPVFMIVLALLLFKPRGTELAS